MAQRNPGQATRSDIGSVPVTSSSHPPLTVANGVDSLSSSSVELDTASHVEVPVSCSELCDFLVAVVQDRRLACRHFMTTPTFLPFIPSHVEPCLFNQLRASPAAYEKAWLSARLLSSMDTHLPERAFSLMHGAFILGVPSSRKRNFGGTRAPPDPPVSPPMTNRNNSFSQKKEKRGAQVGFKSTTYVLLARQMPYH